MSFRDLPLDEPSLLPGWTRRHLVAHVGYNAAALCNLMDWAATGIETPMYASADARASEIADGATLNPAALRNLFDHTVARLDEKWRHLPGAAWQATVRTAQGRSVPATEVVWLRTREVWIHSVDLGTDGRFGDFPGEVLDSLLADIVGVWRTRGDGAGLVLEVDGCAPIPVDATVPASATIAGPIAAAVRWAAGRGSVGLRETEVTTPPRWL